MIEVRAIIRPHRLEKLRDALRELPDFPGMTVLKVQGFTAPSALPKRSEAEELTDFTPKLMLIILTQDSGADAIWKVIRNCCSTDAVGDGLIWTVEVKSAHRIKDGSNLDITPLLSP
jgi:nitrogen regulatory protein P-II 1